MWCPCVLCRFLAGWPRRAARPLIVSAAAVAMIAAGPAADAGAASHHQARPVFRPPVDAPVADPFRSPEDPYGPGNRGIEYDTESGDAVRAAASGTVEFAGAVAGALHVTVDHGGGLRSSYSYLQRISVRVGAHVARGAVIGIAGDRLHFGVRLDGVYTDPDTFIGVRRVRVRLVPLRGERSGRDPRGTAFARGLASRSRSAVGPRTLLLWPFGVRRRRAVPPNHFATRAFTRSSRRPARATQNRENKQAWLLSP